MVRHRWLASHSSRSQFNRERRLERETGIEPATNSLEGCDSTTELLPPSRSRTRYLLLALRRAGPPCPTVYFNRPPPVIWLAHRRSLSRSASGGWWRGKDSNLRSR